MAWQRAGVSASALIFFVACSSDQSGTPGSAVDDSDDAAGAGGGTTAVTVGVGGSGGGGGEVADIVINEGFIGGPCESNADCDYDGGFCLTDAEGFPDGMCSLDCGQFCPDEDGMVTTFCTEPDALDTTADEGLCTIRCDYGQSPSGCRTGYQCQIVSRYAEPETETYACVPGDDDPFELGPCHDALIERGVAFSPAVSPMDSPEGQPQITCDIEDPIWIEPYLADVAFRPSSMDNDPKAIFTSCPHGIAMHDAAEVLATQGATDLVHYGVYNCRTIAGTSTLSQHGLANAIDIAGIQWADEGYFSILGDWEKDTANPSTTGGQLLKTFVETIFDALIYNIILTPDYNEAHADHFHCDLTEGSHFLQ